MSDPTTPTADDARRSEFKEKALSLLDEVYGVALRMTKNPDAAQDLVAEAYARAWKNLPQFEPGTNIRAWLYKILTNHFINEYRKKRREPEKVSVDAYDKIEDFHLFNRLSRGAAPTAEGDPVETTVRRLTGEDFQRALDELPEDYRAAILLYDLRGLSYQETAEALEVPVGTVRSRLSRGRRILQASLYKHARDAGIVSGEKEPARGRA